MGLLTGLASGLFWMEIANKFGVWTTTPLPINNVFGSIFIGFLALMVNLAIVLVGSLIALQFSKK